MCLLAAGLVLGGLSATREPDGRTHILDPQQPVRDWDADVKAAEVTAESPPQVTPTRVTLSTVTVPRATALAGKAVLVTLDLLENDDQRGGFVVYSNDEPDGDEDDGVERSVWVPKGMTVTRSGRYRGTLTVHHHAAALGADGTEFPAWVEVRVVLAR